MAICENEKVEDFYLSNHIYSKVNVKSRKSWRPSNLIKNPVLILLNFSEAVGISFLYFLRTLPRILFVFESEYDFTFCQLFHRNWLAFAHFLWPLGSIFSDMWLCFFYKSDDMRHFCKKFIFRKFLVFRDFESFVGFT